MTTETLSAGDFSVDVETRTVRGLLLPWGEASRLSASQTEPIAFERGTVRVPADLSPLSVNRHHNRHDPVASFSSVEDTEAGLVAEFSVSRNPEGDEFLAEYASGKLRKLSGEFRDIVRDGAKGLAAVLTGAAFVTEGAFASAALFALGDIEEASEAPDSPAPLSPDEDGDIAVSATETPSSVSVTAEDTTTRFIPEPESEESAVTSAIPETMVASATTPEAPTFRQTMTMLASAVAGETPSNTLLAALNDVKFDSTGGANNDMNRPQWLGELWAGKSFERKVVPLFNHADLTAIEVQGYRWVVKPEMAAWAGNKAAVPSNTPTTETIKKKAQRLAGGHDISREYVDFPNADFWTSYYQAMTESYARLSDAAVLTDILASSTAVTRGTVPTNVSPGLASIVDGATAILDTAVPSFAIVAKDVYRDLMLTRQDNTLAFLNAALGLEEGSIESFKVIPHAGIAAGKVLVGNSSAATVYELPGVPVKTESLDQIRGGIDSALFGYYASLVHNPKALALVSPGV